MCHGTQIFYHGCNHNSYVLSPCGKEVPRNGKCINKTHTEERSMFYCKACLKGNGFTGLELANVIKGLVHGMEQQFSYHGQEQMLVEDRGDYTQTPESTSDMETPPSNAADDRATRSIKDQDWRYVKFPTPHAPISANKSAQRTEAAPQSDIQFIQHDPTKDHCPHVLDDEFKVQGKGVKKGKSNREKVRGSGRINRALRIATLTALNA